MQNVQTTGDRQPVHIDVFFFVSLRHQRPHHAVGQRQGIQLLNDSLGRLAAQVVRLAGPRRILVDFLFVKIKKMGLSGPSTNGTAPKPEKQLPYSAHTG